jgi:hypothetical protein
VVLKMTDSIMKMTFRINTARNRVYRLMWCVFLDAGTGLIIDYYSRVIARYGQIRKINFAQLKLRTQAV